MEKRRSLIKKLLGDDFFKSFNDDDFFSRSLISLSDNSIFETPSDDDKNYNKTEEVLDTKTHSIKKETWVSRDGTSTFSRIVSTLKEAEINDVDYLKSELSKAVENQEFERAIDLRDRLRRLG